MTDRPLPCSRVWGLRCDLCPPDHCDRENPNDRRDEAEPARRAGDSHISEIDREVKRLREIEAWTLAHLKVHEGDAITLKVTPNATGGWRADREHLVEGATGTVKGIFLSRGVWFVYYEPDVEWRVSDFDGARYVPSHSHTFMLPMRSVRKRRKCDRGLTLPENVRSGRDALG